MDRRRLLLGIAKQFYEDCRFISETNATQQVDEDTCLMFNNLLRETQAAFSVCVYLNGFREFPPRSVKFKDAVVVAGQLLAVIRFLCNEDVPVMDELPTPPPSVAKPASAPAPSEGAPGGAPPSSPAQSQAQAKKSAAQRGFLTEEELRVTFDDLK